MNPNASGQVKESEDDMPSLAIGFVAGMHNGRRVLKGKLHLTLKYLVESAQSGLAQMKRLKRAWQ